MVTEALELTEREETTTARTMGTGEEKESGILSDLRPTGKSLQLGQATCLADASFLSISCVPSNVAPLYDGHHSTMRDLSRIKDKKYLRSEHLTENAGRRITRKTAISRRRNWGMDIRAK